MHTIHLDPAMVPAALRGAYQGRKFKAIVAETVHIPADAGLWSGGSRDHYHGVELETGKHFAVARFQASGPFAGSGRENVTMALRPGFVVVMHSTVCGNDAGLTFYVHPDNAAKLLPAPCELTTHEKWVLYATRSYKASYAGRDRYAMCQDSLNATCGPVHFPTRAQWEAAKAALISRGLLNKAGAITPAGRNAAPARM